MSDAPRLCVVGSSNMDLTFRAPRLPRPGETVFGESLPAGFGGKGANQAVMAARLGATVAMVSRVGHDQFGDQILDNFRTEGIDVRHVGIDREAPTGVAAILVDARAQNCIVVAPGANLRLTERHIEAAADAIRSCRVLLVQLEVPMEALLAAFRIAREAGVQTVLNPAPAGPLPEELLQLADFCVPNETELELLTGQAVATLEQVESAAQSLRRRGPANVIVTLGERGALLVGPRGSRHLATARVQPVDPTGAGDAFIGTLGVSLAQGDEPEEGVRRANRVASISVLRAGAQASFPRYEDLHD